jgi:hypothetical protein
MGCTMDKKITFTLDDDIVKQLPQDMMINDTILNRAVSHYLQSEQESTNHSEEMTVETKMKVLESEKIKIEEEKQALEIDNECLKQQMKRLESRIDDLAELYPSASVLLGKKPTVGKQRKPLFKNKIFKK